MANSNINWTDIVWNPTTGCTKVSKECTNCYAEKMHHRLLNMKKRPKIKYNQPFSVFVQHESELNYPLTIKKPKKIFVNSMSDLFHEKATFDFVEKVFETMLKARQHTYQILTKRPKIMLDFVNRFLEKKSLYVIPEHIWLGTSIGIVKSLDRIDILKKVRVPVKFISFEPLLEDLGIPDLKGIAWAIVGGESGNNFRQVKKDWIIHIKTACEIHGVSFFFKQWSGATPNSGGRQLDGKTYDEFPKLKVIQ